MARKGRHHRRVEVSPGGLPDALARGLHRDGLGVGTIEGHRVEGVGHREDAGREGNRLAGQPERVAGAVPPLVVVVDDRDRVAQEGNPLEELAAHLRMAPHDPPLVRRERAGLEEDRVGDADLADVVQQHAAAERVELRLGQAVGAGQRDGVAVHAAGVGLGAHLASGQRRAEGFQGGLVRLPQLTQGGGQVAGRLGHAVLEQGLVLAPLHQELAALERPLRGEQDLIQIDRLEDEVARPLLEALDRGPHVGRTGEHDDRRVRVPGLDVQEELEPVHDRHLEVSDGQGRALGLEEAGRLPPVAGHAALVARGAEDRVQGGPDVALVVHDQHAPGGGQGHRRGHPPDRPPGGAPMSSWTETRFLPARLAA